MGFLPSANLIINFFIHFLQLASLLSSFCNSFFVLFNKFIQKLTVIVGELGKYSAKVIFPLFLFCRRFFGRILKFKIRFFSKHLFPDLRHTLRFITILIRLIITFAFFGRQNFSIVNLEIHFLHFLLLLKKLLLIFSKVKVSKLFRDFFFIFQHNSFQVIFCCQWISN